MRILPTNIPGPVDLRTHAATHGTGRVPDLLSELRRSGLRGRGGASREVVGGLDAVREAVEASGRSAVVVVNGVEGEPLSSKDAHLLATVPHLVLDGAQAVAEAVGATDVVVCAKAGPGLDAVTRAIDERNAQDWPVGPAEEQVSVAAPGFVAGQETAVVAHLDGLPARPRGNGRPISRHGVAGRPTLVKNVETLAHVGLVSAHGASAVQSEGTREDPGTLLLTVHLPSGPRVVEAPHGTPLNHVLDAVGADGSGGVLLGGFHGGWMRGSDRGVPLTRSAVEAVGGRLGSGIVRPVAAGGCPLSVTASIVAYLAVETVRQCGPCTFGMPRLAELTWQLASCRLTPQGVRELLRTVGLLENRGACRHPDASAAMVASCLKAFPQEVGEHVRGRCAAGQEVAA